MVDLVLSRHILKIRKLVDDDDDKNEDRLVRQMYC